MNQLLDAVMAFVSAVTFGDSRCVRLPRQYKMTADLIKPAMVQCQLRYH